MSISNIKCWTLGHKKCNQLEVSLLGLLGFLLMCDLCQYFVWSQFFLRYDSTLASKTNQVPGNNSFLKAGRGGSAIGLQKIFMKIVPKVIFQATRFKRLNFQMLFASTIKALFASWYWAGKVIKKPIFPISYYLYHQKCLLECEGEISAL